MLQIAVCDDDPEAVRVHKEVTEDCLRQNKCAGRISLYTSSGNLLCDIIDDHFFYDLILLDIEMPGNTGMEIAEKIRPYLPEVKIMNMPLMHLSCPFSGMCPRTTGRDGWQQLSGMR